METDDAGGGVPSSSSSPLSDVRGARRRSEPIAQCIKGECTEDDDNKKLKCDKCDKLFHYRCTGLPVFQIHHFLTKGYRKFMCESCTKVPEHLKAIIPTPPPTNQTKQVLELEKKVKEKQMEVDTLAATNRLLQAKIKELTSSNAESQKDCEKEKDRNSKLQAKAKKMEGSIKSYEAQIATLNEQNASTDSANSGETLSSLTRIMGEKFEEIQNNLKSVILTEVSKNNLQLEEKINAAVQLNKSYADTVTNTMTSTSSGAPTAAVTDVDFRAVMREERNSQLAEETDKKMRACNFIIHGCLEANGEIPERKEHDKNFINALFADIGIEAMCKSLNRLGKRDETSNDAKRPIKVVMQNETEKDLVMARLNNLKGKEKYKGISITDDHSIADRKIIKEWAEKATAANANEPTESLYEWKVRGSPKNGMQLKKFRKRTPSA